MIHSKGVQLFVVIDLNMATDWQLTDSFDNTAEKRFRRKELAQLSTSEIVELKRREGSIRKMLSSWDKANLSNETWSCQNVLVISFTLYKHRASIKTILCTYKAVDEIVAQGVDNQRVVNIPYWFTGAKLGFYLKWWTILI